MPSLLERIGNRTVLIDANLPIQLADSLRQKGLSVRHVSEINPKMSDTNIQNIMYPTDVLLTRDGNLYWQLGRGRAIFLGLGTKTRRRVAEISRFRKTMEHEQATGAIDLKIQRGMRILFYRKGKYPEPSYVPI